MRRYTGVMMDNYNWAEIMIVLIQIPIHVLKESGSR